MLKFKVLCLLAGIALSLYVYQGEVCLAAQVELGDSKALTAGLPGDQPFKPKVAYNSKHDEYLVVYHWRNDFLPFNRQVHGARLTADGDYIENFIISDLPNGCASADVAYDPVNDRYLVVWVYDKNGDGSDWNVHGRFVPYDGPSATLGSAPISEQTLWDELGPKLAYGSAQKDFFLVVNLLRNDGSPLKPYVGGFRIKADGTVAISLAPDFTIIEPSAE